MQNIADCACADHLTRLTDERIASVRIRYAEQQTALLRNAGKLLGFLGAERKRLVAYNVDAMLEKALCNLVMRIACCHDGDKINTVLTRGLLICQARRRSYQISASEVCDAIIASAMQQAAKPSLLPGPAVGSMPRRWLIQCCSSLSYAFGKRSAQLSIISLSTLRRERTIGSAGSGRRIVSFSHTISMPISWMSRSRCS